MQKKTCGGAKGERVAEYHRGQGTVHFILGSIPASEWFLIFIHEIAHRADPLMKSAIAEWADSKRAKRIILLGNLYNSTSE